MIDVDLDFMDLLWAVQQADRDDGTHFLDGINPHRDNKEIGHRGERGYHIYFPKATYVGHKERRYDFLHPTYYPIPFVDVKGRRCKHRPGTHYWVNIRAADMPRGKGVIYSFVFVDIIEHRVWLVGWIEADVFAEEAQFFPKGSRQPDTNIELYADTHSMKIHQLIPYERG
jgi:hypothetical protein